MNDTHRVQDAILRTIQVDGPYLLKTLKSRTRTESDGSYFETLSPAEILRELLKAEWTRVENLLVTPPAVAFQTSIPYTSVLGVIEVAGLPLHTQIEFRDPKGTIGTVGGGYQPYAVLKSTRFAGPTAGLVTLLLGPGEDENASEIVWTVFPGGLVPYVANMGVREPMIVDRFMREFPQITHVKCVVEP